MRNIHYFEEDKNNKKEFGEKSCFNTKLTEEFIFSNTNQSICKGIK